MLNASQKQSARKVFQLISDTLTQFPFKRMVSYFCERLNVSRSGYYSFLKAKEARATKEQLDLEVRDLILKAFNRRGYKKGSRSIKMTLEHDMRIVMNRKKIQRIMSKYGIVCPHRKPNPYKQIAKARDLYPFRSMCTLYKSQISEAWFRSVHVTPRQLLGQSAIGIRLWTF